MKKIREVRQLLRDSEFTTKVKIFFAFSKSADDDFDPEEANYTYTNLNPKTIKAYVSNISAEAWILKEYGVHRIGAIEIIAEDKYETWFQNCQRVVVNDIDCQVFQSSVGSKALIQKRAGNLIRVLLQRKD